MKKLIKICLVTTILLLLVGMVYAGRFDICKNKYKDYKNKHKDCKRLLKPVCCHSFGYGSMMIKCCDKYEWKPLGECLPTEWRGGGQEVVSNHYC